MTRRLLVTAALAAGLAVPSVAAQPAAACDPNYDPRCVTPCSVVDRYHDELQRYFAEPLPKPVC